MDLHGRITHEKTTFLDFTSVLEYTLVSSLKLVWDFAYDLNLELSYTEWDQLDSLLWFYLTLIVNRA